MQNHCLKSLQILLFFPIENVVAVSVIFIKPVMEVSSVPFNSKVLDTGDSIKYPLNGSNVSNGLPWINSTFVSFIFTISLFFCINVLLGSIVMELWLGLGDTVRPNDFFTPASKINS